MPSGKFLAALFALTPIAVGLYLTLRSGQKSTTSSYRVLADLEHSVSRTAELYNRADREIKCSLCREALNKIKKLPIEQQAKGIRELRSIVKASQTNPVALMIEMERAETLNKVMGV